MESTIVGGAGPAGACDVPNRAEADAGAQEVLVVDDGVRDADVLLAGLVRPMRLIRLGAGDGGFEQIARALRGARRIKALHILCHGEPGVLIMAGQRVDLPGLVMRPALLADIGAVLGDDATVVLYGCAVAAAPAGLAFLERLEALLGAPVAASAGPVGAAALGGAWVLRLGTGRTVATAFTALARSAYPGLLRVAGPMPTGEQRRAGPLRLDIPACRAHVPGRNRR